jgi:glycosyltransferase involved in cell wall biosynthesis
VPKITVIIPTHNRERFIGECIESVLHQTFTDFNLIVIDDGSTDNTRGIVNEFKDPRIAYIYQENHGVSAVRNSGAKMTSAKYLAFLDSDDMYLDNALEKLVDFLDAHEEVGFVYGQSYMTKMDTTPVRVRKSFYHDHSVVIDQITHIREMLFHKPWNVSCCAIRRDCFNNVGGFNEDLWFGEDYEFFIRMSKRYPAGYVAEPLAKVRIHNSQLQDEVKPGRDTAFLAILQEVFKDPNITPHVEDLRAKAYCHIYQTWLADAAYNSDMKLARRRLSQAVGYYPPVIFKREFINILYRYLTSFVPKRWRLRLKKLRHILKLN